MNSENLDLIIRSDAQKAERTAQPVASWQAKAEDKEEASQAEGTHNDWLLVFLLQIFSHIPHKMQQNL